MQEELTAGITLNVIPTKQFKTTRINISFLTELSERSELVMRTLLADLLETSSQKYPTQKDVALELSEMYGASFGTTVDRRGQVHSLNFILNCVNDNYLLEKIDLLAKSLAFLQEMIMRPLVDKQGFDQATFTRQKQNLKAYIEAVKDNKQTYAALKLQENYFETELQKVPLYGTVADLEELDATKLYHYYQKVIATDQVQIVISGDVDPVLVQAQLKKLALPARPKKQLSLTYQQAKRAVVTEVSERQELNQSKLDLAYRLPVSYRSKDHYAALIFNALFGGTPQSRLFANVREKASLAYYANSSFDPFRQLLIVQTGIKATDRRKAQALIADQLAALKNGEFSAEQLEQVKLHLLNAYESRLDNQQTEMTRTKLDLLAQRPISASEWKKSLLQVTKEDICRVAALVELQTVFFLDGGQS